MQFMVLIQWGDGPSPGGSAANAESWEALSPEEQQAIAQGYGELVQTPGVVPGAKLGPAPQATTVRVVDGETVTTRGPFVDIAQSLSGYFLLEADDLDAAVAIAAKVPHARYGGAVEIRPVLADGYDH